MVGKALETVCAFANTRGGMLVLGVEDFAKAKGMERLFGIGENPEAVDELLRKLNSHLLPAVEQVEAIRVPCCLRDGASGFLVVLKVPVSDKVHSILDDGTWIRGEASNREMTASEITNLSYRRGVRSAESEPVDIDFDLLDGEAWRLFLHGRGLQSGGLPDMLYRIGLAKKVGSELRTVGLRCCYLPMNRVLCSQERDRVPICGFFSIAATLSRRAKFPTCRKRRKRSPVLFISRLPELIPTCLRSWRKV
jgi:ATP-dependent DNA helicase RecG